MIVDFVENGFDFEFTAENITFSTDSSSNDMMCLHVDILDDFLFELNETITLGLRHISPNIEGITVTQTFTTVIIVDNEGKYQHRL